MFFNTDGSIKKVIPTLRGVGLTKVSSEIQIDRFSRISDKGATIAFNDSLNTFKGWKTVFNAPNAWVQYNSVDFEKGKFKTLEANVHAINGGTFEVHLDKVNGPLVAVVKVPKGDSFSTVTAKAAGVKNGIHHLFVVSKDNSVEVDWIRFK
jgi:hypothetical protein